MVPAGRSGRPQARRPAVDSAASPIAIQRGAWVDVLAP